MSEVFHETNREGWQMRSRIPVDSLLEFEDATSDIRTLHDWWQTSRAASRQILHAAPFLDVRPGNPLDYLFCNHRGRVYGSLTGIRFHQYPLAAHARACASEYMTCKVEAAPVAHHVEQHFAGVDREYLRLMCPLFDPRGRVATIVYAYRHLQEPLLRPARS